MTSPDAAADAPALNITNPYEYLKAQLAGQHKFTGPVYVTGAFRRPRTNADLDNRLKGIADLLQLVGVIDNDKNIMGVECVVERGLAGRRGAEISIVQADAVRMARAA